MEPQYLLMKFDKKDIIIYIQKNKILDCEVKFRTKKGE